MIHPLVVGPVLSYIYPVWFWYQSPSGDYVYGQGGIPLRRTDSLTYTALPTVQPRNVPVAVRSLHGDQEGSPTFAQRGNWERRYGTICGRVTSPA